MSSWNQPIWISIFKSFNCCNSVFICPLICRQYFWIYIWLNRSCSSLWFVICRSMLIWWSSISSSSSSTPSISFPYSFNCHIIIWHSFRNLWLPSYEMISISRWSSWWNNWISIISSNWYDITSSIHVKRNCILINIPYCYNFYLISRHLSIFWYSTPSNECMSCPCWISW